MKVSLIVATFQRVDVLRRFLNSVSSYSSELVEVLVVDQNKDERLNDLITEYKSIGLGVRHLRMDVPNLSAARNLGIIEAKGEIVAFPDDDCWYDQGAVFAICGRFESTPHCTGVVATWLEQELVLKCGYSAGLALSYNDWRRLKGGAASSICLFIKRKYFFATGKFVGFDERLGVLQWFGSGEETDLVLSMLKRGCLLVREPSAHVRHDYGFISRKVWSERFRQIRSRARGTGALYSKHRLDFDVVLRGLLSPWLLMLAMGSKRKSFVDGLALFVGRLEGMVYWRWKYCRK
jgi:glycosyltransferase involved in cell wall biosynthesis